MVHKYVKEITHWANGGMLQCWYESDETPTWIDYLLTDMPEFDDHGTKWRIKLGSYERPSRDANF